MTHDQDDGELLSVDELEGRLKDVELVMNQLQAGELDPAESTIDMLAQKIEDLPIS